MSKWEKTKELTDDERENLQWELKCAGLRQELVDAPRKNIIETVIWHSQFRAENILDKNSTRQRIKGLEVENEKLKSLLNILGYEGSDEESIRKSFDSSMPTENEESVNTGADWDQSKRLVLHWHDMWKKAQDKLDWYQAPEHIKYAVRMYSDLDREDRIKIDNLVRALKECKS